MNSISWLWNDGKLLDVSVAAFLVIAILGSVTLMIREILSSLGKRKITIADSASSKSTEYWVLTISEIVSKSLNASVIPVLEKQAEILEKLSDTVKETRNHVADIKSDLRRT